MFGTSFWCLQLSQSPLSRVLTRRNLPPDEAPDRYSDHMAKQVTATDAKATILRLLDDAAAGEEIEITRHGRPVARLVPASGARSLEGSFEGVAMTAVEEQQLFSTGEAWNAS